MLTSDQITSLTVSSRDKPVDPIEPSHSPRRELFGPFSGGERPPGADPLQGLYSQPKSTVGRPWTWINFHSRYSGPLVEAGVRHRLIDAADGVQKILGDHQDSVVTRQLLRRLGAKAFTLGRTGSATDGCTCWTRMLSHPDHLPRPARSPGVQARVNVGPKAPREPGCVRIF